MKRFKKILTYAAVVLIIMAAGLLVYGFKDNLEQSVEYSSYSTEDDGTKVLYLLAKEMGYDVKQFTRPARFLPDNATLVVIEPNMEILDSELEKKYLKAWIERGNVLFIISNHKNSFIKELGGTGFEPFGLYDDDGSKYSLGKGTIISFFESSFYLNSGVKDIYPGVQFIDALEEGKYKTVIFDEYLHGVGSSGAKLWDILSFGGKLVVIQLIMALLIYIYMVSRRFGKPVVVFENVKRKENENLFALSNIYFKAKANSMALEIYLDNLKGELAKFLGFAKDEWEDKDLIRAAKSDITLKDLEVEAVFHECESFINNRKRNDNMLLSLYKKLETIRKGIK